MPKNVINGEVRISLPDYHKLLISSEESEIQSERIKETISVLGDFLQFLKTKQYFKDIVNEFNASHNRLSIKVDKDGRVKLYLDGQKIQQDLQD